VDLQNENEVGRTKQRIKFLEDDQRKKNKLITTLQAKVKALQGQVYDLSFDDEMLSQVYELNTTSDDTKADDKSTMDVSPPGSPIATSSQN
jgi:hypothetical protein